MNLKSSLFLFALSSISSFACANTDSAYQHYINCSASSRAIAETAAPVRALPDSALKGLLIASVGALSMALNEPDVTEAQARNDYRKARNSLLTQAARKANIGSLNLFDAKQYKTYLQFLVDDNSKYCQSVVNYGDTHVKYKELPADSKKKIDENREIALKIIDGK